MGFRRPQTITRVTAGAYVSGVWVPGVESPIQIMASIQPVTGEDQITPPEGKRLSDFVKAYTDTDLQVLGEVEGLQPDRLTWRGSEYECVQADVRQMDVINHYKYIFSKVTQ